MATGSTPYYDIPFPLDNDPVSVQSDIQSLAEQIELILPTIGLPYHTIEVHNESGSSISKGDPVYISGFYSGTSKPSISKCQSDDSSTFPILGLAKTAIGSGSDGLVVISGVFTDINTAPYSIGDKLYVGATGGLTHTQPSNASVIGLVAKVGTNGVIIVGSFKGNGTWGSLKAGLA